MLKSIDMVVLYVRDWPAALSWYQERLGLICQYLEEDHSFAVLGLPEGGPSIHLVGDRERGDGRNRCVPNVSVTDLDAAVRELEARGVEIRSVQVDDEDGYRLATIADPEGNELNLYTFMSAKSPG